MKSKAEPKTKQKIKMGIDVLMTLLLLGLMACQVTGQLFHEWLGTGMLVLFIAHNILNIRWYGNLIKGKYRSLRIMQTIVNFSVLISMLCLGYSGIVMSRYVFAALPVNGPMATARRMHMAASYWGFVLMSLHLGMHWGMVTGMLGRLSKGRTLSDSKWSGLSVWILQLAAVLIAGYGLLCFIRKDIVSYMFLQNEFVFFDFEQSMLSVILEYAAMMGFWILIGYFITKGIGKLRLSAIFMATGMMMLCLCGSNDTGQGSKSAGEDGQAEIRSEETDAAEDPAVFSLGAYDSTNKSAC